MLSGGAAAPFVDSFSQWTLIKGHLCVLRIGMNATDRNPFPSRAYILENINIVTKLL